MCVCVCVFDNWNQNVLRNSKKRTPVIGPEVCWPMEAHRSRNPRRQGHPGVSAAGEPPAAAAEGNQAGEA